MKLRIKSEDRLELSTICRQLKMISTDGKRYLTDVADAESVLRIVQSVPSPRAEPFKLLLARVETVKTTPTLSSLKRVAETLNISLKVELLS